MKTHKILPYLVGTALVILLLALATSYLLRSPITELHITRESITLAPGQSIQLTVEACTADGTPATAEQLEKYGLSWQYKADNNAFTVNENGLLTALTHGIGNVWTTIRGKDGEISSRAITVTVE